MKNIFSYFLIFLFLTSFCFAATQKQKVLQNDYLYSEEYFDYLIECAEKEKEELKKQENEQENEILFEIPIAQNQDDEIIINDFAPFKLKISESVFASPYSRSYKVIDSKTIIPVGANISFVQDLKKSRNKYNSNDYKILAGAEYELFKYLRISGGLETNYRGVDQIPSSRKLYISPTLHFNDVILMTFYNKLNVYNNATDHDLGLNISPFKSKFLDFGVYAGVTKKENGDISQSINFSTNINFF